MDFFHLDALSSAVALRVDFDVVLTEIATGLDRLMARQLTGYEIWPRPGRFIAIFWTPLPKSKLAQAVSKFNYPNARIIRS